MIKFFWIILFEYFGHVSLAVSITDRDRPMITIEQGQLRGQRKLDYWGREYFSFEGIPFAEPPLGALRFKAPKPPKPWSGIFETTNQGMPCPQKFFAGTQPVIKNVSIGGSEDCLFLDVYTHLTDDELKPVMVSIHAGGFLFGANSDGFYGEQFLMSEDIVLVKIQYRVDVLGFMSHPNPDLEIPGNAGLKDQVMALKWIQKNIKNFGGNPDSVTIFGFSAGGASSHLLYLSPMAKGLFSGVIAQSGAADEPWFRKEQSTVQLAEMMKCPVDKDNTMIDCLREKKAEDLIEATVNMRLNAKDREYPSFGVVIENITNGEAFLSDSPENIIKNGQFNDVPFLSGYLPDDGILFISFANFDVNFTNTALLIPNNIKVDIHSNLAQQLGDEINQFYFGDEKPPFENLDNILKYLTDVMILERQYKFIKQQVQVARAPQYFYQFLYHTDELSPNSIPYSRPLYQHVDDIHYLFVSDNTPKQLDPNSDAYRAVKRTLKIWTTFARTGNPNPTDKENDDYLDGIEWKPVTPEHFYYLNIAPTVSLAENPVRERMEFWEKFYAKCKQLNIV